MDPVHPLRQHVRGGNVNIPMDEENSVFVEAIPYEAPVLVVLIEQDGCPACEEYHPTFVKAASWYAKNGLPILRMNLTTLEEDAAENASLSKANTWMNEHGVDSTPTVIVTALYHGEVAKLEGVSSEGATRQILDIAWAHNRPKSSWW
jgi:thiol-disulfide isomerase/thioredoxin